MDQDIINDYRQRISSAEEQAGKYKKLSNTYSLYRLVIFGLLILSVYLAVVYNDITILIITTMIMALCFAWLVSRQSRFDSLKQYYLDLKKVNENELESMQSRSNIYDNGDKFADDKHFYTADLDIFGNASLFQLINRAATVPGLNRLADWLKAPSEKTCYIIKATSNKRN